MLAIKARIVAICQRISDEEAPSSIAQMNFLWLTPALSSKADVNSQINLLGELGEIGVGLI
jgi:hypothetical protein